MNEPADDERTTGSREARGVARWDALVELAESVRSIAIADFSGFSVGAAVELADGSIFAGVNVENDTFALTVCAERVAVYNALMNHGGGRPNVVAVAVVVPEGEQGAPCGACRQVLYKFGPEADVSFVDSAGVRVVRRLSDLLPEPFGM